MFHILGLLQAIWLNDSHDAQGNSWDRATRRPTSAGARDAGDEDGQRTAEGGGSHFPMGWTYEPVMGEFMGIRWGMMGTTPSQPSKMGYDMMGFKTKKEPNFWICSEIRGMKRPNILSPCDRKFPQPNDILSQLPRFTCPLTGVIPLISGYTVKLSPIPNHLLFEILQKGAPNCSSLIQL